MELKRDLPPNRTYEQVMNHYLVEKSLADKLKQSDREERKIIYSTMYDELFSKVPDHPRLTIRESEQLTAHANKSKFAILSRFLKESDTYMEFAPGDCKFALEVTKHAKFVYGVDISDQRNADENFPDNFKLVLYDGYNLDQIESESIDLVFSDQLLEHFHPDDTKLHFEIIHRILKKGGKYVFRTPHRLTGPHDVSQYFSYEPECFHLKEWTYVELKELVMDIGYSKFQPYWKAKSLVLKLPYTYFSLSERIHSQFPLKYARIPAKYLISSLLGVVVK